ncbi:uncharacterized protein LOC135090944 [Scylla paramamosain]|uniref:uncharacterized protein LOC135090944 n=1 Tax=Scylla paramamosain TaxID=85552 RepID=UPI003082846B
MCGRHRAAWAALALCLWSSVVWVGAGEGRRTRLVTKAAGKEEGEALPRPGASTREREIAAIFRGVAYGAPTTTTSSTTSSTTTTATSTSASTTIHPTATSPPLRRRQEGGDVQVPAARDGPGHSASRRDEEQRGGGGSSAAPPVAGGASVVNSTAVSLGPVWSARVYLTGGLFGAVGVAALCLMPRAAAASPLLAAPHHFALHLLVLAAAACRCLHLLHAAPHLTPALPPALLTAAEEGAWPLLTAALAVVVGGALRAWVTPARPRMALVLAGAAAAHLASLAVTHVGVVLLQAPYEPLSVAASAVAIAFGAGVGMAGLWTVWPLGRGRSAMGELQELGGDSCSGPAPPTHLLGAAAFLQLLLAGARLYFLATPPSLNPRVGVVVPCHAAPRPGTGGGSPAAGGRRLHLAASGRGSLWLLPEEDRRGGAPLGRQDGAPTRGVHRGGGGRRATQKPAGPHPGRALRHGRAQAQAPRPQEPGLRDVRLPASVEPRAAPRRAARRPRRRRPG